MRVQLVKRRSFMSKIVSKARLLRSEYERKQGRTVTAQEVAAKTGIHYNTLSRIERGKTEGIDFETLAKLCEFYGVGVGAILEFDPEGIESPELAFA
jgi:DNA-binding Xre family transcriptional regulator